MKDLSRLLPQKLDHPNVKVDVTQKTFGSFLSVNQRNDFLSFVRDDDSSGYDELFEQALRGLYVDVATKANASKLELKTARVQYSGCSERRPVVDCDQVLTAYTALRDFRHLPEFIATSDLRIGRLLGLCLDDFSAPSCYTQGKLTISLDDTPMTLVILTPIVPAVIMNFVVSSAFLLNGDWVGFIVFLPILDVHVFLHLHVVTRYLPQLFIHPNAYSEDMLLKLADHDSAYVEFNGQVNTQGSHPYKRIIL